MMETSIYTLFGRWRDHLQRITSPFGIRISMDTDVAVLAMSGVKSSYEIRFNYHGTDPGPEALAEFQAKAALAYFADKVIADLG